MKAAEHLPPRLSSLLSSGQDYDIRSQRHSLQNDGEGHEETNRAPHRAKVAIAMAVLRLGEVVAGAREGRAPSMEAVCIVYLFTAGL